MNTYANLENRLVVGASDHYDALSEEPTPEEEQAMDELRRARTARSYESVVTSHLNEKPRALIETTIEVFADLRDRADGEFFVVWHDAINRRDEALIGKLFLLARDRYVHACAVDEVGVK